jgi:hypothetical protein
MDITVADASRVLEKLKISGNTTNFILQVLKALIEMYLFNPYISKMPEPEPERQLSDWYTLEEKPKKFDKALLEPYSRYILKYFDVIDDVINTGISIDELKNKMQGIIRRYDYMINKELPFNIKQLAVTGNDLLEIFVDKKRIAHILNEILFLTASSKLKNDKNSILFYIKENYSDFIAEKDVNEIQSV